LIIPSRHVLASSANGRRLLQFSVYVCAQSWLNQGRRSGRKGGDYCTSLGSSNWPHRAPQASGAFRRLAI
jgi:hypothetical protein